MRARKPAPSAAVAGPNGHAELHYAAAAAGLGPLPSARRVPAITNPGIMDAGRRTKQNELKESLDQQLMMKKAVQSLDKATSNLLEQQVIARRALPAHCKTVTLCRL